MRARDLLSNSILSLIGISLFLDLLGSAAISQGKATTVTGLKNKNGATLIAVGTDGSSVSEVISGNKQTLQTTASSSRIYLIENGSVSAELVGPTCAKNKKKEVVCNTKSTVSLAVKKGAKLSVKAPKDGLIVAKASTDSDVKKAFVKNVTTSAKSVSDAVSSLGRAVNSIQNKGEVGGKKVGVLIEDSDPDNDGLVSPLDSDDDGDGILDNYDSTTTGKLGDSFNLFSNLKLPIDGSLNLHSTGLTSTAIDTALQSVQTLAIGVSGSTSETAELNCGTLAYCTSGGTGTTLEGSQPFPGTAGGALDGDSDGYGSISKGSTNDFQLKTGATSSTIGGGDTFIQQITATDSSTREVSGMLNFVFNSVPALKSVAVNGGAAETVSYTTTPVKGSSGDCFAASASGDVTIEVVGWRPQRPGVSTLGEGTYVDIGSSQIVADIPNAPCVFTSGGCSGTGPGNCTVSSYSTSDANLTIGASAVQDNKGDIDASSTNTYTLSVNLTNCLNGASGGAIAWNANETLFVDLQFKSSAGDNAAQKFCVKRAAS